MANLWTQNPIILDTQNDDVAYDSDNDAHKIATGLKYSTKRFKIGKIRVSGANSNQIVLKQSSSATLEGPTFLDVTLETGDLNKEFNFDGMWINGIIPKTITSGAKVCIEVV